MLPQIIFQNHVEKPGPDLIFSALQYSDLLSTIWAAVCMYDTSRAVCNALEQFRSCFFLSDCRKISVQAQEVAVLGSLHQIRHH